MNDTPRQLPIIKVGDKSFFKDDRLQQYRNTKNPHEFYSFEEMHTLFQFMDIGGKLINSIVGEAEKLGISVYYGQSLTNGENITNLITPDGELITVCRIFAPDEEHIEEVIGES